jgi:hypothetical protein
MFSCDERKKVIKIAAELWGEDKKLKMADELMACMAIETKGEFDPALGYPNAATGLVQFTNIAIDDMNRTGYNNGKKLTKKMLAEMTALVQLDYVKLYFDMWMQHYKKTIEDALDMYMTIWCPAAVGKSDSFVCYTEIKNPKRYKENKSIDGEYYQEKGNKILRGKANQEITKGELRPRLQMWYAKGIPKKNKCKTDSSTCEFGSSKGEVNNSDLNIPTGINWLESKAITKEDFDNNKDYIVKYKQESGKEAILRTENTDKALEKMDCSELVCRYLQKIGWSLDVKWLNSSGIITYYKNHKNKFEEVTVAAKGDVFVWEGHTGVIVKVDSTKVTTIEAIEERSYSWHEGYKFDGVVKWEYELEGKHLRGSSRSQKFYILRPKTHYTNE